MPVVEIKLRNRSFTIACDNGQQDHVQMLAGRLEERLTLLAKARGGMVPDATMLVMAALMLEDELAIATEQAALPNHHLTPSNDEEITKALEDKALAQANDMISQTITGIAEYIESIANRLEKA